MSQASRKSKTDETDQIERLLKNEFPNTEAYRYNSASIRVRVIDERFTGKSISERDRMVSPILSQLPDELESEILMLLTLTPEETKVANPNTHSWVNREFDNPSFSSL